MTAITEMHGGTDVKDAKGLFGEVIKEEDFEKCFDQIDIDGSGGITKDELLVFIK